MPRSISPSGEGRGGLTKKKKKKKNALWRSAPLCSYSPLGNAGAARSRDLGGMGIQEIPTTQAPGWGPYTGEGGGLAFNSTIRKEEQGKSRPLTSGVTDALFPEIFKETLTRPLVYLHTESKEKSPADSEHGTISVPHHEGFFFYFFFFSPLTQHLSKTDIINLLKNPPFKVSAKNEMKLGDWAQYSCTLPPR